MTPETAPASPQAQREAPGLAKTCAWHVYRESRARFVDSSEGFHLDEGDRMFWQRTYASMADEQEEAP